MNRLDPEDWAFIVGVALVSLGAGMVALPLALIVPGAALIVLALGVVRRGSA